MGLVVRGLVAFLGLLLVVVLLVDWNGLVWTGGGRATNDALFLMAGWFVVSTLLRAKPLYALKTFAKVNFSVGLVEIVLFAFSLRGACTLFPQEQAQIRDLRPIQIGDTTLVLLLVAARCRCCCAGWTRGWCWQPGCSWSRSAPGFASG